MHLISSRWLGLSVIVVGGFLPVTAPGQNPVPDPDPTSHPGNEAWDPRFSRGLGEVHVLREQADGSILAGGRTLVAPGSDLTHASLLRWRPATGWEKVAHALSFPPTAHSSMRDALDYQGAPHVLGPMSNTVDGVPVRQILKFIDGTLSGVGGGLEGTPTTMIEYQGKLVVGGNLQRAGEIAVINIASWDGSNWSSLGAGVPFPVRALAEYQGELIAAGDANTPERPGGLLRWDGAAWHPLADGVGPAEPLNYAGALLASGTNLFVAGRFALAGDVSANNIARWDGSRWHALGTGLGPITQTALALREHQGELVAAGHFRSAGDLPAPGLASWNGTEWIPWTGHWFTEFNGLVRAEDSLMGLGVSTNTFCGGRRVVALLEDSGSVFQGLGFSGIEMPVIPTLAAGPDSLLVGGKFYPDGAPLWNCLASWNGTTWSDVGGGIGTPRNGPNVEILAVATAGSHHAMGGRFSRVRDLTANHIARWDGQAWQPMGEGLSVPVSALAWQGHRLIAGGTSLGVAVWNGRAWQSLGRLPSLAIPALAVDGEHIFAAGFEASVPFNQRTYSIHAWNGLQWTTIADQVRAPILSLHHDGQRLLAGGRFTEISGVTVSGVAAWDGLTWTAVGSRLLERPASLVNALTTDGRGRLYVAGNFVAEPSEATCIAFLHQDQWQRLGSGISPTIPTALAWWQGAAYVGGNFIRAGDKNSYGIGRWSDPQGDFELSLIAPLSVEPGEEFTAELRLHRVAGTTPRTAEIHLPLPPGVSFASANHDGHLEGPSVRWSIASSDSDSQTLTCRLLAPNQRTLLSYRNVRVEVAGQSVYTARVENTWVTRAVDAGIARLVPPANGTLFAGQSITLEAECDPGASTLAQVTFHANDQALATLMEPPWRFDWTPTVAGNVLVRASCEDTTGGSTLSLPAPLTIRPRPVNDAFSGRLPVDGYQGGIQVDTTDATFESQEPDHGVGTPNRSLWWSFTPTRAGRLYLFLDQPNAFAAVYQGDAVHTLTRVVPDPIGSFVDLAPGISYAIAVDAQEPLTSFAWNYRWLPVGGRLLNTLLQSDGNLHLHFEGFPGAAHHLESSTDLLEWELVESFVAGEQPVPLVLPRDPASPFRFFRVR